MSEIFWINITLIKNVAMKWICDTIKVQTRGQSLLR